jgi:hypothetical protein
MKATHFFQPLTIQWATLSIISLALLLSSNAEAVPAFARQMGTECSACHFQHYSKLNAFGRYFKSSGFSMTTREDLKGDGLSIAPNLNATFFLRARYVDESSTERGTWELPDEAAILIGGRLAEGIGGLVEWGGPLLGAKISYTREMGDAVGGVTVFATDALGAAYGFELMNTGAVRNMRPFERSSKPTLGNNSNLTLGDAATGLAFHASASEWFTAATFFVADSAEAGRTDMDAGGHLSHYLRAAYMPTIGGWDTGFGAGVFGGSSEATVTQEGVDTFDGDASLGLVAGDVVNIKTNAWFVDAQLQGRMSGHDMGVYFLYAEGEKNKADNTIHLWQGASVGKTPTSWGIDAEYSFIPSFSGLLSFGENDNGTVNASAATNAGVGFYWMIGQNISLQGMYEVFGGDQGPKEANGDDVKRMTFTLESVF